MKTTDGGLRDQSKTYTNYDDVAQEQKLGKKPTLAEINAANNSIGFVAAVNSSALCGFSDWRMPGTDEMYHLGNQTYFPETTSSGFWSASPVADYSNFAWGDSGGYYYYDRNDGRRVRLVRGGQSFGTFVLSLSATGSGSGALSADDGSLNCVSTAGTNSGVCSNSLFTGATVTLTATPTSGSKFTGWSGACSASAGPTCTVKMDAAKSVSASFNSGPASQSITFDPAPSMRVGSTATLKATASSGLAVTLASSTMGICRVSGNTLSALAAGTCTLTANQAGNASFSPAPQVTQSFSIAATAVPPGTPTKVVITPGSGSATIRFSPPSNEGGAPIYGYTATCTASGQSTRSASGSTSPLTVKNLSGGVLYRCTLIATNSAGLSSSASVATPVTPLAGKNSILTPIMLLLL